MTTTSTTMATASTVSMQTPLDIETSMRAIMYPTLPIVVFALFVALIVALKTHEQEVLAVSPRLLMAVSGLQMVLAILWIVDFQDGIDFMQFLFAGIIAYAYALMPERIVVGQFSAVVAVINFFCLLGLFPVPFGWSGSPAFDTVSNGFPTTCNLYYDMTKGDGNARCSSYLNALQFSGLLLVLLQPFILVLSYTLFHNHC